MNGEDKKEDIEFKEKTGSGFMSKSGVQNPEVMRLRIDPSPMLTEVYAYLSGDRIEYVPQADGGYKKEITKIGEPKMNQEGINSVMNWIKTQINSAMVQGNFPVDGVGYSRAYDDFCFYFHINFAMYLQKKRIDFDLLDNEYKGVVDIIVNSIRVFLTRLIGNEERKSYAESLISSERFMNMPQKKKSWWHLGRE